MKENILKNLKISDDRPRKTTFLFIRHVLKIIFLSLVLVIILRYFVVQTYFVDGSSMVETFTDKDLLLIDKVSYKFHKPERGDVIIFRYPLNPKEVFIKRIVALPGEKIEVKNNEVKLYNKENPNGIVLNESYIGQNQKTLGDVSKTLSDGEYFVMGDNRLGSSDSRRWGVLDESLIEGKFFLRLWH